MSHPIEIAAGLAVAVAVGVGTLLVLPKPRPEPAAQTIVLDINGPETIRAEPAAEKTDAERIEALQRQLLDIAAEQKRLTEEVRAAAKAHVEAKRRGKKAP